MPFHALSRQVAHYEETAFITGGPADWSDNGTYFFVTNVDTSAVEQTAIPNENNVTRPRARHDHILGLRQTSFTFGTYLHAKPTHAAEAAQATSFHLDVLLRAALGGRRLGWSIGLQSSGGELTTEIEVDSDPGFEVGDWIYAYDDSAGRGYFYRIEAIAAGPPVTLTIDRARDFTPTADDSIKAVIDVYIDQYATTNHASANHKTLQMLVQGDATGDVVVCKGCKPNVTIAPFGAGTGLQVAYDMLVATFDGADTAIKDDFGAAVPVGEAPIVPGVGDVARVLLANVGSALAPVVQRGQITIAPGVTYQHVEGVTAAGTHGYVDDVTQDTTLQMMVDWSSQYATDFRARQRKHAMIEVGSGVDVVAFYWPELEIASEPTRNDEGALTGSSLNFRAHLRSGNPGSLTGDALQKWLSPMHILIVA